MLRWRLDLYILLGAQRSQCTLACERDGETTCDLTDRSSWLPDMKGVNVVVPKAEPNLCREPANQQDDGSSRYDSCGKGVAVAKWRTVGRRDVAGSRSRTEPRKATGLGRRREDCLLIARAQAKPVGN